MRMSFEFFGKSLFGAKYERIGKSFLICLVVYLGLHNAGFHAAITPFILYLMTGTFTAGVMWQVLSSDSSAANMKNLFMLPFENRKLLFSYVCTLGAYTLVTRTGTLLAIVYAVSAPAVQEIAGSILCALNAAAMAACIYAGKKHRGYGLLWAFLLAASVFLLSSSSLLLLGGNLLLAVILLKDADAYSFYGQRDGSRPLTKKTRRYSVRRYLFRYLLSHKNYLANTLALWGIACFLPMFFKRMDMQFVLPAGFAVLSLNTPICILLSCDPALGEAVRFLPGQKKVFCLPYCFFIFGFNITADLIFLISWQIQSGGVTVLLILTAFFFALQSAVGSVLLEWYFPIRGWKIESDLWHHPRKYVMPVFMLLAAGIVGILPELIYLLPVLLPAEIFILYRGTPKMG